MESSIECLKKLSEKLGQDWKKRLSDFLKEDNSEAGDKSSEDYHYFVDFIDSYREDFISNNLEAIKAVEVVIDNDLLYNEIKDYIEDILGMYYEAEPVRVLEVKDYDLTIKMVDFVFEQAIVRFNPDVAEKYEDYGFCKKDDFVNVISVLDFFCFYAVKKNLYKTAIIDGIYENIRISKKLCQYIGNKIDKNFEQLRVKMIIDKLYD